MITRIQYTIADGNAWTDETDYDANASLTRLAELTEQALRGAYPEADVTVTRERVSGAVRAVRAYQTTEEYGEEPADDGLVEQIAAIADRVWEAGDWYVKAA